MAHAITLIRPDRVTATLSDHPDQTRSKLWIEITSKQSPQPHRHLSAIRVAVLRAARSAIEREIVTTDHALNPEAVASDPGSDGQHQEGT
jgi:hypothetical protein